MPISQLELMEMFAAIMAPFYDEAGYPSAHSKDNDSGSSYFNEPFEELGLNPISLARLLGDHPNFLQSFAQSVEDAGDGALATVIRSVEKMLADPSLDLDMADVGRPRLSDDVYTVV